MSVDQIGSLRQAAPSPFHRRTFRRSWPSADHHMDPRSTDKLGEAGVQHLAARLTSLDRTGGVPLLGWLMDTGSADTKEVIGSA